MKHSQISSIMPLFNLTPGFLAIMAFLFLGERLNNIQISGIVLLIIGAYVLETEGRRLIKSFIEHIKSKYIDYAIFAAFIFSITALLDKYIINTYLPPFDYFFLLWIFISINFMIASSYRYAGLKGIKHCLKATKHTVIFAAFFSFIANILHLIAMSMAYVSLVVPVRRLSTLLTTLIGGELFHEKALVRKSIACVIMIVGAYLIII